MTAQERSHVPVEEITLVSSGDLRLAANQQCWPAQERLEQGVTAAFRELGIGAHRAHGYDPEQ